MINFPDTEMINFGDTELEKEDLVHRRSHSVQLIWNSFKMDVFIRDKNSLHSVSFSFV